MFKYTIHVNYGIFALKSDIKYEKGEEKCECRDLILAKFHKYISLSKKEVKLYSILYIPIYSLYQNLHLSEKI